jgi:hypothetical protein
LIVQLQNFDTMVQLQLIHQSRAKWFVLLTFTDTNNSCNWSCKLPQVLQYRTNKVPLGKLVTFGKSVPLTILNQVTNPIWLISACTKQHLTLILSTCSHCSSFSSLDHFTNGMCLRV